MAVALCAIAGPWIAGCTRTYDGLVAVSGTVTIDGQPLTRGQVMVYPEGKRSSLGVIGPDGRFELSCRQNGDGVFTGKHPAAVLAVEQLGERSNRWYAPKHYSHPTTSNLWVAIDGPTQDLKIELTWKGSKQTGPYEEKF